MPLLARWVINALLFLAVANLLPQYIHISGFGTALWVALLWGLAGVTVKPVLFVLTLPVNLLTLGLFTFVINGFLFWLLSRVTEGFTVSGFWGAFVGALLLSALQSLVQWASRSREQ